MDGQIRPGFMDAVVLVVCAVFVISFLVYGQLVSAGGWFLFAITHRELSSAQRQLRGTINARRLTIKMERAK